MALMTRTRPEKPRRRGGRHARSTSLWQQLGWGRRTECVTPPQALMAAKAAPTTPPAATVAAIDARFVVELLFDPENLDLSQQQRLAPLDWVYGDHTASAHVDPGLIPAAARDVMDVYAEVLRAPVVEESAGGRVTLRTSCVYHDVQVTVRADVTPEEPTPVPERRPVLVPRVVLPLERQAMACLTTQEFIPVTAEVDEGPEHSDADPDTGAQETEPEGPSREPADPLPTAATAATEDDDTPLPADADEQNQDTAA